MGYNNLRKKTESMRTVTYLLKPAIENEVIGHEGFWVTAEWVGGFPLFSPSQAAALPLWMHCKACPAAKTLAPTNFNRFLGCTRGWDVL